MNLPEHNALPIPPEPSIVGFVGAHPITQSDITAGMESLQAAAVSTPTNDAESRATFEAWRKSLCAFTTFTVDAEGFYEDDDQQVAWSGWQARDAEVAAKDERIAELEEESKEWNQRYMAQALLAQRLLKAGGCAELIEELRAKLIATQAELEEQCGANTDFIRQYQDQVAGLNLRLAAREAVITEMERSMTFGAFQTFIDLGITEPTPKAFAEEICRRLGKKHEAALAVHTAHVIESAVLACEAVRDTHGAHGNDATARGAVQCIEAIRAINADQVAKETEK